MKILHITTHLGGGIGTVLINWADNDKKNKHVFMCLGYNLDSVKEICANKGIELYSDANYDSVVEKVPEADIVILHYWNHPLLVDFLVTTKLPKCRLVTYSHTSGRHVPYVVPYNVYEISSFLVHSSITSESANQINTIMSTGGTARFEGLKKEEHSGFNVIYIGTLDFSKLRNDFSDICSLISQKITDSRFIVCGSGSALEPIKEEIQRLGISDRFLFTGFVDDLSSYLKIADVLLYPLAKDHYGTGEQVIGEAMSCGVVPVVFNNQCESSIIKNKETGLIVESVQECVDAVCFLRENEKTREELSKNAQRSAKETYSIESFLSKWEAVYKKVLLVDKDSYEWDTRERHDRGVTALAESLGEDRRIITNYINSREKLELLLKSSEQWKSKSKGSINQYIKHFPQDKYLNIFKSILDGEQDDNRL